MLCVCLTYWSSSAFLFLMSCLLHICTEVVRSYPSSLIFSLKRGKWVFSGVVVLCCCLTTFLISSSIHIYCILIVDHVT